MVITAFCQDFFDISAKIYFTFLDELAEKNYLEIYTSSVYLNRRFSAVGRSVSAEWFNHLLLTINHRLAMLGGELGSTGMEGED